MKEDSKSDSSWFWGVVILFGIIYCIHYTVSDLMNKKSAAENSTPTAQTNSNSPQDFENERSCGKDGLAWANKFYGLNTRENSFIKTFHFNKKLNVRLVKVEILYLHDSNAEAVEVYNVYTQEKIDGYYYLRDGTGALSAERWLEISEGIRKLMNE